MLKRIDMSQGESSNPMVLVNGVCASAASDSSLGDRVANSAEVR
jgi:hypothetical protein